MFPNVNVRNKFVCAKFKYLDSCVRLTVFNPIIQFLQDNSKFGYKMQNESFITLPFADDFCLITTDLRTHQRIINQISSNINSMGLRLKPSKCRSFSIRKGKPEILNFKIEGNSVPSISEENIKTVLNI